MTDTAAVSATEPPTMTDAELAAEIRKEWIDDAVIYLLAPPFSWTEEQARSYADAIADTYIDDGHEPEDAVEEDRQYWD